MNRIALVPCNMCELILNSHYDHTKTSERDMCILDNISIKPMYRTNDSLSYQVSRCNYCGREWGEFWVSYKYIFSSMIDWRRNQHQ
jgi:hypothetical protein